MNPSPGKDFEDRLRSRLEGVRRLAIIGIGDEFMPADSIGMSAAREIGKIGLPGVKVFLAGTVPESVTGPIRTYRPDHVLMVDAADMGAGPGTLAIVEPGSITANLFSTHYFPLSVVMEYLSQDEGTKVILVGIQPDNEVHCDGLSPREREALRNLIDSLTSILGSRHS
ncbi:MAG: hydrogenase 3 maturation endopeptidase HyCI [Methanoregulaceae archaeon]|nr:hydrogenase 3 maturation endopeptidase HyCI [Methanoregulaceae archaeon]